MNNNEFKPPFKFEVMMVTIVTAIFLGTLHIKLGIDWLKPFSFIAALVGVYMVFRNWYASIKYEFKK